MVVPPAEDALTLFCMNCLINSLCAEQSCDTRIDRNLIKVNSRPPWPTRFCVKNTGPLDDSLTAIAVKTNTGDRRIMPTRLPAISMHRLAHRENLFASIRFDGRGYKRGSATESSAWSSAYSSGNRDHESAMPFESSGPKLSSIAVRIFVRIVSVKSG